MDKKNISRDNFLKSKDTSNNIIISTSISKSSKINVSKYQKNKHNNKYNETLSPTICRIKKALTTTS